MVVPQSSPDLGGPVPVTIDKEYNTEGEEDASDISIDIHELNPGLPLVDHRFYFPETWIWQLQPIGLVQCRSIIRVNAVQVY